MKKKHQEQVGETLSRITPTSSLTYLATNLTQTGKRKRNAYFQAGERYYDALHTDVFSKIVDHASVRTFHPERDIVKIRQPSSLETPTLGETFRQSAVDVPAALLLCCGIDNRSISEILPLRYLTRSTTRHTNESRIISDVH